MKARMELSLGKLPNDLSARLREVETEHVDNNDGAAHDAREELLVALQEYHSSRYKFGRALAAYKVFFLADKGWIAAAKVLAKAIGCDESTIRRIIKDYERVSTIPEGVIRELESHGIDPAAKKHEQVIANILKMPPSVAQSNPKEAVAKLVTTEKETNAARKPIQSAPTTKIGQDAGRGLTGEAVYNLRLKLRKILADVEVRDRLMLLRRAVEAEMYEVWGVKCATVVTFTPAPSPLRSTGQAKNERVG